MLLPVALAFVPVPGIACSFAFENWPLPDPPLAIAGEKPPALPPLTIDGVVRGQPDGNSCSDLGFITLSAPVDAENITLYYEAEIISSTIPAGIFMSPMKDKGILILTPSIEKNRISMFFLWLDGAKAKQEPVELKIRVTAFRRSGLRGESRELTITDPGRQP